MEGVESFLCLLFIIIVLIICIVIEMKVLIWTTHKLRAYVQYVGNVLEVFHANKEALQLIEPTDITVNKEDAVSENDGSRLIQTSQGKKNKKPFKEKAKGADEVANRGRHPISVSVLKVKQGEPEGQDSVGDNFCKADKYAPNSSPILRPKHTHVVDKKANNLGQVRLNNASVKNPYSIITWPVGSSFHKTSPRWNSTLNSQLLCSNFMKQNRITANRARSNGWTRINSKSAEKGPISRKDRLSTSEKKLASPGSTVFLWSVDINTETPKDEASNGEIISAPRTVCNKKANVGTANNENYNRTASNEMNSRSSKSSVTLMVVAAMMVRVMMDATQPLCARVDRMWDLLKDAVQRVGQHGVISWFTVAWKKARVSSDQEPFSRKAGIFYASVSLAFASVKSKVAAMVSRMRIVLISGARKNQSVSCQDLSLVKEEGAPGSTITIPKGNNFTQTEKSSEKREKSPSYDETLLRSDKSSRKEKVASAISSARFAVKRSSADKTEKTGKNKSSTKDDICAARTVNSSPSRNKRLRQDSSSRRRKRQSQSLPNVNQDKESTTGENWTVKEKATSKKKEEVMPQLIPPSQVNAVAPTESSVKRKSSSKAQIPKFDAGGKPEVSILCARAKRRPNEVELMYSKKQHGISMPVPTATITDTRPRENMKRKPGSVKTAPAQCKPMYVQSSTEADQGATQLSENATQEQLELMEVGQSVEKPFIIQPEPMEVNTEPVEVEESFEEARRAYYELQASATGNVTPSLKPKELNAEVKIENVDVEMETTQEQVSSWNFLPYSVPSFSSKPSTSNAQPAEEDMETGQVLESSWNFFPFSLPTFLETPFTSQPVEEEMEVVELPILVPPSGEEPDEMEIYSERIDSTMLTGQSTDAISPVLPTGGGRKKLAVPSTLPQQGQIRMNHSPLAGCIAASPFGEMTDAKRPLASTVGQLKNAAMPKQFPFTEPAITKHSGQQPQIPKPAKHPYSPQVITSLAHLGTSVHPRVNSFVNSVHHNLGYIEPGLGKTAPAVNTPVYEVRTLANQLTMEQLQLAPPASFTDESDFESDDDSDEEYELDLDTIKKFSELESSPDHAQLINKILMEKESTQWHSISDSDSDCIGKCEMAEPLDTETIEKYSELEGILEISPEEAKRLTTWLSESESSQCEM